MSFFEELKRRNVFRVGIAYGVAAWLLIQVTDIVFPRIGLPDSAVTLVIALLAIGFIPALIFAWAFEMTPEGVKREADVDRTESITPNTGKKLDRVIIAGLVLIIAGMGIERFWFAGQSAEPAERVSTTSGQVEYSTVPGPVRESVAVLPFTSMSSGEDDGYFADGLTEEILNSLAALPELLVTARTSSFHFKDQNLPVQEIAVTLGVDHIVEGSVRRSGEQLRITAQLIRANDGFHLWSDTYDRTLEDVFAVQEEIAEAIAGALDVVLDEEKLAMLRKSGIRDVDAFIAYQKGLEAFGRAHESMATISRDLAIAVAHFDTALAVSPDLVGARIMKADQKGHILFELTGGLREEAFEGELNKVIEELREEYRIAIDISPPGNQKDILEFEAAIFSDDWTDMSFKLDRALRPGNCPSLNWTPDFAVAMGRGDKLIAKLKEQIICDPFGIVGVYGIIGAHLHNGRPQESIRTANEASRLGAPMMFIDDLMFLAQLAAGNLEGPEVQGHGNSGALIPFSRQIPRLLLMGDTEAAMQLAQPVLDDPGISDWSAMILAAILGDRDRANRHASLIDARPGSTIALTNASLVCACGAPFDLESTPNLKARVEVAGFDWPPPKAINYPAKDW